MNFELDDVVVVLYAHEYRLGKVIEVNWGGLGGKSQKNLGVQFFDNGEKRWYMDQNQWEGRIRLADPTEIVKWKNGQACRNPDIYIDYMDVDLDIL